jgi:hypothetical protein
MWYGSLSKALIKSRFKKLLITAFYIQKKIEMGRLVPISMINDSFSSQPMEE